VNIVFRHHNYGLIGLINLTLMECNTQNNNNNNETLEALLDDSSALRAGVVATRPKTKSMTDYTEWLVLVKPVH